METCSSSGVGLQLVVAVERSGGIGKAGTLPWSLPGDMAYFRELTSKTRDPARQNAVIMGRKTWESIPDKHRPLKGRLNIVLSRSFGPDQQHADDAENRGIVGNGGGQALDAKAKAAAAALPPGVLAAGSLEQAVELLQGDALKGKVETVFVIGGAQVFAEALASPACTAVHITRIDADYECDTFFPTIDDSRFRVWSASQPVQEKDGPRYTFVCYTALPPKGQDATPPALPPSMASRHDEQQVRGHSRLGRAMKDTQPGADSWGFMHRSMQPLTLSPFSASPQHCLCTVFPPLTPPPTLNSHH